MKPTDSSVGFMVEGPLATGKRCYNRRGRPYEVAERPSRYGARKANMPSQTWVARFVVDHGQVTEEGGRLRSFPRRRLDEPEADLHVLAEPGSANAEEFASQALDAIGRVFVRDNLSLTGALQRSIASTHQTLADWNRRSVPRDQVALGITAAVVVGSVVYLAQAGSSLVFHKSGDDLRRLVPEGNAALALGEPGQSPALRRIDLKPGDLVLAASQSLETLTDEDSLSLLLARGSDEALPQLYLQTRNQEHFALFAITCYDTGEDDEKEPAEAALEQEAVRRGDAEPTLSFASPDESEAPTDEAPEARLVAPKPLDISRPVVRLRPDQGTGRGVYPRATGAGGGLHLPLPTSRMLAAATAIVLIVLVGALAVPDLVRENRTERSLALLFRAQEALAVSNEEENPDRRRRLLEETRRLSTEAHRIDPENLAAEEVRQQATAALATLDAVFELSPVQTVVTLSRQLTGEMSIEALTIAQDTAFLLDTAGGRIVAVPLAGGPPLVVFESGQSYGGTPAKRPQFMTWDDANNRLLVLDIERKLYEMRAGGAPQPLPLRRTSAWRSVAAIAAYDGNLYVLDPRGNYVHRYLPAAAGYDSEPTIVVGQVSLAGAQGLAVDGDIYVTFDDGRVRRFQGGAQAGLLFIGIDRPLVSPGSVSVLRAEGLILVADRGNKRAVLASKDGVFQRQYVSNAFTDLRAVAADPLAGQLYAVVGDALLTAPMLR
jgi:hypothetical protein